jgi:TRAP-type C4-dicarboxylate transport system substrate-binding protein
MVVFLALPMGVAAKAIKLTAADIHPQDYPTTRGLFKFAELWILF